MANIIKVDYEAIPRQTMSMRTNGKDLNKELVDVYRNIERMHSFWFGIRYNELVIEFNKIIPSINDLLELVVDEIPYTLDTVANNYALADRGTGVTKAVKEMPQKITDLPVLNDIGMGFVTNEVENIQQVVSKNFQNVIEKMNVMENEYNRITWQSESSDSFKAKFKKLKNQIIYSFNNLNAQFIKLMNQAKDDMQKAENANKI